MINWFDVPSESPNKDLTLKNLQVSENGTYGESGVAYSSVEVNVSGGGGGSSDFSTAEVTFISSISKQPPIQEVVAIVDVMGEKTMGSTIPLINGSLTVDVVLFKGSQIIYAPDEVKNITVTGNITEEEGEIIISGAGTISYENK